MRKLYFPRAFLRPFYGVSHIKNMAGVFTGKFRIDNINQAALLKLM